MKKNIFIALILLILVSIAKVGAYEPNYPSYTYDYWQEVKPNTLAYRVKGSTIDGSKITDGTTYLTNLQEIFVTSNKYYFLDAGSSTNGVEANKKGKIFITSKDFSSIYALTEFYKLDELNQRETNPTKFVNPTGLFVLEDDKTIYVADQTESSLGFVYKLQLNETDNVFECVMIVSKPTDITYNKEEFKPAKITVDSVGRIYVCVKGAFDGIVEFDKFGNFSRFYGTQPVSASFWDLFWRFFMSEEQKKNRQLFLPTEYTNLAIDQNNFVYATAASVSSTPIQKINPKGKNVLISNGYVQPIGDIQTVTGVKSSFRAIDVNNYGMYSVLDQANKKIFTYNEQGYLMYVNGFEGSYNGNFINPMALKYDNELLLVGDNNTIRSTITIFEPTTFGEKVNEASRLSYLGKHIEASEVWQEVLEENDTFSYAYIGIGNMHYRKKEYKNAMDAYKLGQDKINYSKAYKFYRKEQLSENFNTYVIIGASLIVAYYGIKIVKKFRKEQN